MNNNRTNTSTQIRNLYSEGYSCLNMKFFNMNLLLQWYPFTGKDSSGRSQYDTKGGQQTTVNIEGAYALYHVANDILDGKVEETNISIPCLSASITMDRKRAMDGQMETIISITKNGATIPFKFQTIPQQFRDSSGQIQTKFIEVGLGAFMKTLEGYLTGINAGRHLDKLTEDYIRMQDQNGGSQNSNQPPKNNNKYRNNYNNNRSNNGYQQRPYNNKYNQSQNTGWNPQAQSLNSYELPE